jgi:integrase/recombinase XerD
MFGKSTKGRKFPVEILTSEEVRSLMNASSRRGTCGIRDRALIALLYRGGLRIAEALDLLPKDFTPATGEVRILNGKGGKARTVAIDPEAVALVELWLSRREKLGLNGRHPLFCTLAGAPLSRPQVTQNLKALAVRAGIQKRVHPHGLRHSRAVDLVKQGVPLTIIQAAYGHASLQTTATYVSHIAPQDVVNAMRGGTW